MAGNPVTIRRALKQPLSQRRLEANRRNAARSTGPRTADGKARVARNAIKHGFFAAQVRWTPEQHRAYAETLAGLRDELKPDGALEDSHVVAMAASRVKMAFLLRYENIAALKYHRQRDREIDERIASSYPAEAARLADEREQMRRAGLWKPTIPAPGEAMAIARYEGSLNRTFYRAWRELETLKGMPIGAAFSRAKSQKQTHLPASRGAVVGLRERPQAAPFAAAKVQKQTHCESPPGMAIGLREGAAGPSFTVAKNVKTNPISPAIPRNRHERRRARALGARRR